MKDSKFMPITLQRPMRLFKAALGPASSVGIPLSPDHDFLVRLLTDHRSHKAMLRTAAQDEFKNLENFLRGRHHASPRTMKALSGRLAMTPEELSDWAHGQQKGPLAPKLLEIFALFESIPAATIDHSLKKVVPCPCCGRNLLDDVDVFWSTQPITYAAPEYLFAERLLRAAVGASLLCSFVAGLHGQPVAFTNFSLLSEPSKYPMSHWLDLVQAHSRVSSLPELAIQMQLMTAMECRVPYERLKKWSCGQDLMPVAVGKALSRGAGMDNALWSSFLLARTFSFIIDFLVSAAPGSKPERSLVQRIVHCRYLGLVQNVRISAGAVRAAT